MIGTRTQSDDDDRDFDLEDERAEQQFRDRQHRKRMGLPFGHPDDEEPEDD